MFNQLIGQNTLTPNTQTLNQMTNQSIDQLNAHSIHQSSTLALNPLNNQSSNSQIFSDVRQQINQLNSINQKLNPLAQIDHDSYNFASTTPAQIRSVTQSIIQSISQLTQDDQMQLIALIDNTTRTGGVTSEEIAAILSRSGSQTNNQMLHPSINQAGNPLLDPVTTSRLVSQTFYQCQSNIA